MASSQITSLSSDYKDLDLRMKLHPLHGDIRPVKDIDAIKNSIKNILLTKRGERPFKPKFGCNLSKYLFEPADAITTVLMKEEIEFSLSDQEPRVEVRNITIEDEPDNNAYSITIDVLIVNLQEEATIDLLLKRLR